MEVEIRKTCLFYALHSEQKSYYWARSRLPKAYIGAYVE